MEPTGATWSTLEPHPWQPQQPLELRLEPEMRPELSVPVPVPLPQSGQEEGSPKDVSRSCHIPPGLVWFFHCFPAEREVGQEHPCHAAFVFPSTTWLSMGPVAILPLAGKPHWVLSSGSVLVCPVVNPLL